MGKELENIDLTVSQRKEIAALLKRHLPDTEVWAYGSRVKFTAKPHSDLDVVAFASKEQSLAVANLKEAFEESSLPFRVDFFVWDEVPEQFHKNIKAERMVLQEKNEKSDLPEGWQKKTLGDIADIEMGQSPKGNTCNKKGKGTPLLNGPTEFRSSHPVPTQFTTDPRKLAEKCDLLFCVRGSTTGRMNWADQKYAIGRGLAAIRHKAGGEYQPFVKGIVDYQLPVLLSSATGSTFPNVSRNQLIELPINLPPLTEQKAIAHILGSLDDKIELNRRMNETLEAMAQALFKSWFVDFDPVLDNAILAGNPIPDELEERAEVRRAILAQNQSDECSVMNDELKNNSALKPHNSAFHHLFPSEFEHTEEMGWIPKGWTTQPLYEIANFINGAAYKNFYFTDEPGALPVVKIAEIKNGVSAQTKFTKTELADKYRIDDGDILFSWSGNPDTSIDTFVWTGGPGWLNQHIFNVSLNDDADRNFVYYQLKLLRPDFAEIARNKQTTGLGHVTAQDMKRMHVTKCPSSILLAFNTYAGSLFDRWYSNLLAIKNKSKLRDTLLPQLLSGEIRIPEAEKLVEDLDRNGGGNGKS